jgi:hypothetical protein
MGCELRKKSIISSNLLDIYLQKIDPWCGVQWRSVSSLLFVKFLSLSSLSLKELNTCDASSVFFE